MNRNLITICTYSQLWMATMKCSKQYALLTVSHDNLGMCEIVNLWCYLMNSHYTLLCPQNSTRWPLQAYGPPLVKQSFMVMLTFCFNILLKWKDHCVIVKWEMRWEQHVTGTVLCALTTKSHMVTSKALKALLSLICSLGRACLWWCVQHRICLLSNNRDTRGVWCLVSRKVTN